MVLKVGTPDRPLGVGSKATWSVERGCWVEGEYWFDQRAADAAVAFFHNNLRLTEGEWAGRPFRLEGWQEGDIVRPLFGWKRADGTRRYRRAIVWVPRKNGKTELAAGVALLALIGDAEPGGQVYSIAKDKDQASLVFRKAVAMVNLSPLLSEHLECFKPSIYCAELGAAFKPLSGSPTGKHGLSMSGLVGDEIHEWPNGDLYTFVHQSSAARRQPLEFLISTAGERIGYGWETWDYCLKVQDGSIDDPDTLVVIYAVPPEADWTDPAVWAQANPNLGVSVKREYLEAECRKARESPRLENDFKRYHLNLWTEQAVRWLSIEKWDACAGPIHWSELAESLRGRRCFVGNDLSQTTDLTASLLVFPPEEEGRTWAFLPRFYLPRERIAERVRRDRVPYDKWVREGALTPTEGNVVDYEFVKAQLRADAEMFQFQRVGFDPWNAMQVMIQLTGEGMPCEQVRQGFLTLSGPSKELERLLLDQALAHGGHPVLRWCAQNVAIETDAAGNIKPSKAKSTERIDGIAALVTGLALAVADDGGGLAASPWDDPNFSLAGAA
ncbi:MAG: terminase large subunit [Brevundimonas sp.]|uniref:terminase large subunit n=1 Tax=Brevundimonas sp. TaxID=1871086 RepID=UPI001210D38E|nr:terminase TerL endonuclease subunit [Brevundimonas sp.]RZJ19114.1 MAG: terminase large subunit [Brevundimonas sp.]